MKKISKETIKARRAERKQRREEIMKKRANSKMAQRMKPVCRHLNKFSVLYTILLAFVINFMIEALSRHSAAKAFGYLTGSPLVFLYNMYLIFATLCLSYLFRRRMFTRILVSLLWLLIGIINGALLLKRVTPFNAQDMKALSEAAAVATRYFSVIELAVTIVGLAAVVFWLVTFWRRGAQFKGTMHRGIAIAVCAALLLSIPLVTKYATNKRVLSSYFGNVAFAYQDYGLPYCFMTSLFNTGINQPEGYTEEKITEINPEYTLQKVKAPKKKERQPNIILIQWESFFDTDEVGWIRPNKDVLPNFHKWEKEFSTGYFKAPSVGAGTANTEFEVLTGMNMRSFGPGEYPFKTILKEETCESAASALGEIGYTSFAFHNNGGNFYSRADVYNNLGFDYYISKEFMNILQYTENGWAKDMVLPRYMEQALDSTKGRDFLFTVTVQGHGDYPEKRIIEHPEITLEGIEDEAVKNKWEYFCNQMYETDKVLGELTEMLEKREEPTIVFIYGDHLPTMGLRESDVKSRYLYNTNFLIWDNMGLEKKDTNLAAYQVTAEVMDRLGIHSGTVFNYHQKRHGSKHYLEDLELVQYDILYGELYIYPDKKRPFTEGHLQMGISDVTVDSIRKMADDSYSIFGNGFTQNSSVYVNDEKVKTEFLNNTRLDFTDKDLAEGDLIRICQVGSKSRIFRSSGTFIYQGGILVEQQEKEQDGDAEF